ncbi:putative tat pathway signal sequence protein [Botrytis cinerea BcDW1]|uniref:Putative tat pathway signal sequence protein n=1 Tax=Botryotinia fuckeliana (strain BcDW1) TaxID=1290391 RepID=M7UTY1_BOTF1|nr:putative tat pathway signal sequence protein [Botrytis cinerea BcDW1]
MADFGVKLEAEQSPSPKDSPVFVGDDENDTPRSSSPFTFTAHSPGRNHSPSPTPSFADEAPSHAIPTWQRCGNLERSTQVDIKEEAVKNGLTTLKELEAALQHHPEFWSSTKWLERIAAIRAAKKECRVLIGFLGVTGAGKSTLINSVLGLEDLLPADDEKACTAVICEISWNPRNDPAAAYVAIIDRISKEDWESELENLFRNLADKISNKDGDIEEPDLERDERIKTAFGKVKCVYPSIKSLEALQRQTVATLMNHCNVRDILGQSKTIRSDDLLKFADSIKPYIDSSNFKEENGTYEFAQWPLVKLVRLQIKAEVLKTGIVLVDLPGSMDTNTARGALAATYTKNLTLSCVVSPTSRAASDKPAQDLLGSITKRYLQLEDQFSSDHLCFIVTKIDSSMSVARYIRTHPEVSKRLTDVYEKEATNQKGIEFMSGIEANYKQSIEESKQDFAERNNKIKELGARIRNFKLKRKRDDQSAPIAPGLAAEQNQNKTQYFELQRDTQELQNKINGYESRLYKAQKKLAEFRDKEWMLESRKVKACIQNRNAVSTTALRDDFEAVRKQMGEKKAEKPLQVFCVSSTAFFDLMMRQRSKQGFFIKKDTGIPALIAWLIGATLGTRSRNAESFLADIESLETSLRLWAADTTIEYKLPDAQKDEIENAFDEQVDVLCKKLKDLNTRTVDQIMKHFENGIFKHMPLTEKKAVVKSEIAVRGWAQRPMAWGTHRACNRNRGDWKSNTGTVHHWNDDLGALYLDDYMIKHWRKTVHKTLPEFHQKYNHSLGVVINGFVDDVVSAATTICPQVAEPLGLWKQSVMKGAKPLKDNAEEIFQTKIKSTATDAHQLIVPKIREIWLPIYEKCGEEFGKGHFKRNMETHVEFIQKNGRPVYKKCSKVVRGLFQKLGTTLPDEFSKSTDTATAKIKEEFCMMMDNHAIKDTSPTGGAGGVCPSKVKLRDALNLSFATLHSAWGEEAAEAVVEEEEEEAEEEEIDISEFKAEEGTEEDTFVVSDISDVEDDAKDGDYVPGP